MAEAVQSKERPARNKRKSLVGVVTSAKMSKTRRVEIPRLRPHAKYGKYLRRRTVCYVHDEDNASRVGDQVEIEETRPLSKLKRWRLVRVVSASKDVEAEHGSGGAEAAS